MYSLVKLLKLKIFYFLSIFEKGIQIVIPHIMFIYEIKIYSKPKQNSTFQVNETPKI